MKAARVLILGLATSSRPASRRQQDGFRRDKDVWVADQVRALAAHNLLREGETRMRMSWRPLAL